MKPESTLSSQARGLQLNPRLAPETKHLLASAWAKHADEIETFAPGAVGILTSGSTQSQSNEVSIVLLGESAVRASAEAVNRHLGITAHHTWGLMLPTFHVGGYMIPERAQLSNSRVATFSEAWSAVSAVRFLEENHVTHLSLVPTQVFDIVAENLKSPPSLEAVIVGGGRLDSFLKARASILGWPLLESYGMTEFASQIATEVVGGAEQDRSGGNQNLSGWMKVLSHLEVESDSASGRLRVRGTSSLSGYLVVSLSSGESRIVKRTDENGYWLTQDRVEVLRRHDGAWLKFIGRATDVVKVLGENVDLARVRQYAAEAMKTELLTSVPEANLVWEIVAIPDARREHEIVFVVERSNQFKSDSQAADWLSLLRASLERRLLPVELPTQAKVVREFPRSAIGKVQYPALQELLSAPSKI